MKASKLKSLNHPFAILQDLLNKKSIQLEPHYQLPRPAPQPSIPPAASDAEMFAEAMTGVQRIDWSGSAAGRSERLPAAMDAEPQDHDVARLRNLIDCGMGFVVSDTPEYMEGVGYMAPPEITRRLHRGDFAVQDYVDLHGLTVEGAREAFDAFMKDAVLNGKSAVLVIHGRGLSSPAEPVLKTKVAEWLTSGVWRKWVIAFTSARLCDGGSGASYVLLRHRPITKKYRKQRRRCPPTA
jgi:DNA-nicking Smr family endonuclease